MMDGVTGPDAASDPPVSTTRGRARPAGGPVGHCAGTGFLRDRVPVPRRRLCVPHGRVDRAARHHRHCCLARAHGVTGLPDVGGPAPTHARGSCGRRCDRGCRGRGRVRRRRPGLRHDRDRLVAAGAGEPDRHRLADPAPQARHDADRSRSIVHLRADRADLRQLRLWSATGLGELVLRATGTARSGRLRLFQLHHHGHRRLRRPVAGGGAPPHQCGPRGPHGTDLPRRAGRPARGDVHPDLPLGTRAGAGAGGRPGRGTAGRAGRAGRAPKESEECAAAPRPQTRRTTGTIIGRRLVRSPTNLPRALRVWRLSTSMSCAPSRNACVTAADTTSLASPRSSSASGA